MIHINNKESNQEKWASIIHTQKLSGKSRKVWCLENDVNIHNFVYWNKRLSLNAKSTAELEPQNDNIEQFEWASVTVAEEASEIVLEINAAKIYLKPNFDESLLTKLIRTLKAI